VKTLVGTWRFRRPPWGGAGFLPPGAERRIPGGGL